MSFNLSQFLLNEGSFQTQEFNPGIAIIKEGQPPQGVYYILSGKVDIFKAGAIVNSIGTDHIFGELGIITGQPRRATAIAHDLVKVILIPTLKFRELYQKNQDVRVIVDRLIKEY